MDLCNKIDPINVNPVFKKAVLLFKNHLSHSSRALTSLLKLLIISFLKADDFMTKTPSYTELLYLYEKKHKELIEKFPDLTNPSSIYEKIIQMGRSIPPAPDSLKTPEHLVVGCQSEVYLSAEIGSDGNICFQIASEALISSGLAALLLAIYQEAPPELILLCPPRFASDLSLAKSLSPGRSNGFASIYARMKQEASKFLSQKH